MSHRRFGLLHIAYFTMEIGLRSDLPTYAGGLGVLAGDTTKAAADLGLPFCVVTLLHRRGYFRQSLDESGWQHEAPVEWAPDTILEKLPGEAFIQIEGRMVTIHAWCLRVHGQAGHEVPVIFLDTALAVNDPQDRDLTQALYGGDHAYRLRQEILLGIGGIRMLRAIGAGHIRRYHLNEGHASLLLLELLREESDARGMPSHEQGVVRQVRRRTVFTTHTPVSAGHDTFDLPLLRRTLDQESLIRFESLVEHGVLARSETLNMTHLGLALSGYAHAVARRHGEVSARMFPGHRVDWITNGVHATTWAAPPMAALFDEFAPGWRRDAQNLRLADGIPLERIAGAHAVSRRRLADLLSERAGITLPGRAFVIAFARRATSYKRMDLLLSDPARLRRLAEQRGPIALVFAGKAHPRDHHGKEIIKAVRGELQALSPAITTAYLPGYDMDACAIMIAGADLWLNTPMPPMEASGTSGMKAAINGVPSLSTPDGWWIEGCIEGTTGWSIGADEHVTTLDEARLGDDAHRRADAGHLYDRLEHDILPLYRDDPAGWRAVMRNAIAVNGSYFNTHRMVMEYATRAYLARPGGQA